LVVADVKVAINEDILHWKQFLGKRMILFCCRIAVCLKVGPKLEPDSLDANPEMDHGEKSNRTPQWSLLGPILSAKK
jgi:hypothetical protein